MVETVGSVTEGTTPSGIAYQITSDGHPDLLFIQDGLLPMAAFGQFPPYKEFLHRLGALGRLICFDRRGIGASMRAGRNQPFGLADWAQDARDVLVAVGAVRAIVVALAEGAMTAVALAARHPEAVGALAMINATPGPCLGPLARRGEGAGYIDYLRSTLPRGWAPDLPGLEVVAPSLGRDPSFSAWLTGAFRQAGDARRFLPTFDLAVRSDARPYLTAVAVPTLVVHRRGDRWFAADHGRLLAAAIGHARYIELPGDDHAPYVGDTDDLLSTIRWFVADCLPSTASCTPTLRVAPDPRLTRRQTQVLGLVSAGLTDKDVAARMGISPRTVQKHLERVFRRLDVTNRTAAVTVWRNEQPT